MGVPMLIALSIRNFVLIRSLDLDLGDGFTALTGETGAGKSIILSALGFALGDRAAKRVIRAGSDHASVTAVFAPPPEHEARKFLADSGVEIDPDDPLVLRRMIRATGTARSWLNDSPVSARLLHDLGEHLIEIHGQHASHGLMDPVRQRRMLDDYAQASGVLQDVRNGWMAWRRAIDARDAIEKRMARSMEERAFLEHAVAELDKLDPQPEEAAALAAERTLMQSSERTAQAVQDAVKQFDKGGPEHALSQAARALGRAAALPLMDEAPDDTPLRARLKDAMEAVERALIEAGEAADALSRLKAATEFSPDALEQAEARLFALRAAGRKYDVDPDQLYQVRERMRMQLDEIDHADQALADARKAETAAADDYRAAAMRLTSRRQEYGETLSRAVQKELSPLKLGKARFRTAVVALPEDEAGPCGMDQVSFQIETNPGTGFGALDKIASGGELARFSLALKMCLAREGDSGTLIFDEADVGVGGAVAAAIGERLLQLAGDRQVLAITHSPQVAAAASAQWRISKDETVAGEVATAIDVLGKKERKEEIARMLAGAEVTREARAAANRLLARA